MAYLFLPVPKSTNREVKAWSACAIIDQEDVDANDDLQTTYQDAAIVDCDDPVSTIGHNRRESESIRIRANEKHEHHHRFPPLLHISSPSFFKLLSSIYNT